MRSLFVPGGDSALAESVSDPKAAPAPMRPTMSRNARRE
jgi:hypothetical protein